MKKEAMALLMGYLKNQKELMDRMLAGIRALDTATEERTIHLAYLLHNLYCACRIISSVHIMKVEVAKCAV
jgi:hypothetical protein